MKLFGTVILLPETAIPADSRQRSDPFPASESVEELGACREIKQDQPEVCVQGVKEEPTMPNSSSGVKSGEDEKPTSTEDNRSAVDPNRDCEKEKMETDAASGEQKVVKKVETILSCPRCNSMDTKFCYYNNYNFLQPRHFCRKCQRYWTAGGTIRNVPEGSGRRKNKHLAPHYNRIAMSTAHAESPDLASHHVLPCRLSGDALPLNGNGTAINFGPVMPLYEPMGTVLSLGDKKNIEQVSLASVRNGDEPSSGSNVTASACLENELPKKDGNQQAKSVCCHGFPPAHHLQCCPGQSWSYSWSPGWNNVAAMAAGRFSSELVYEAENGNSSPVPWNSPPMVAAPAFCAPNIPFPFVPASYFSSMPGWAGGSWHVPWAQSNGSMSLSSSTTSNSVCSGSAAPTLGKHSRDAALQNKEKKEVSAGFQDAETYRPDESPKSSICATSSIEHESSTPNIHKAFRPKMEGKGHPLNVKQLLQANPAALARSEMFQEWV